MILGLLMALPTIVISLIALGYIMACLLAVIEDTANGCDQIHEWPAADWSATGVSGSADADRARLGCAHGR